ncbi:hypothetical protein CNMCM6936_008578 [Aspergillus lentulus]|nr:hypothetical protein CNMCM6069_004408 [Aspergillus lentulus]KAF4164818.1 hypothetical protein CNMCM6936_008578 [Aspergillus lentulus]KAF4171633.1 hypothetical protein CNMCM8060_002638 [Aspergillus lentulus]KAF4180055.1 hypothetical protein CNMCM7927_001483 [Aspergillus lentulus]KAF4194254.1 hypothetical protein CNMCM8694_007842 [Aspergillus lentulus]
MPYNTRRKSLSLPSLGIHLPNSSRRSPSASKQPHATDDQLPPSKKVKRSHDSVSSSPEPSPSSNSSTDAKDQQTIRPNGRRGIYEHTPPPSPTDGTAAPKIDTEGINDDIVVGVIEQLEKTGNRPHLVKELAAILVTLNENVANSANPAALLSSRLGTYMKRPWTALAPCPIAKELIPIHPRKVYYYLTTLPRRPIPENSDDVIIPDVDGKDFTPSVSNADLDDEEMLARERSLSPEVDLSSPDFEEENIDRSAGRPGHSFSEHHSHARLMHSNRAASPPLEGDEKEFTQTASAVRERASEQKAATEKSSALSDALSELENGVMSISETSVENSPLSSINEERLPDHEDSDYFSHGNYQVQQRFQQQLELDQLDTDDVAASALFGTSPSPSLASVASSLSSGTSAASDDGLEVEDRATVLASAPQISLPEDPSVRSVSTLKRSIDMLNSELPDIEMKMSELAEQEDKLVLPGRIQDMDMDMVFDSWRELQNPETVEVDELDEMFGEI